MIVTQADRDAAAKFVIDWTGSDSVRHALAALLAQYRLTFGDLRRAATALKNAGR